MVKGYLASNPTSYTMCANGNNDGGNNGGVTPIFTKADLNHYVTFAGKTLHIAGAPATVEIFSIQGNRLMVIDNVSGTLSLASLPAGKYLARINRGSSKLTRAFQIK